MTDYTQNTFFAPKDLLPTGDPNKLILGAELDPELAEIADSIATKLDNSDIATEAQAQEGTSGTTLLTPANAVQLLLGPPTSAGIVGQLRELPDPDADRLIFWDDSAGTAAFLEAGSGLDITEGVLTANTADIDHDALENFEASEHIDHSAVTVGGVADSGLTTGGPIDAPVGLALDFTNLITGTALDPATDLVAVLDADAGHRSFTVAQLQAVITSTTGSATYGRAAVLPLSSMTEQAIPYNVPLHDTLALGTFDPIAGTYTVGATPATVQFSAQCLIGNVGEGEFCEVLIREDGIARAIGTQVSLDGFGGTTWTPQTTITLSLGAGDVVSFLALTDSTGAAIQGDSARSFVSIVELG